MSVIKFAISYGIQSLKYLKNNREFDVPNVLDTNQSIDYLLEHPDVSLGRIGDGEFRWAAGISNSLGFQRNDEKLQSELSQIMKYPPQNMKLAVPFVFKNPWLIYTPGNLFSWMHFWNNNFHALKNLFIPDYQYLDTSLSRLYQSRLQKKNSEKNYDHLKKLWENKRVLTVEGINTLLGINNDLFEKALDVQRIIIPPKNAYDSVDEIENKIRKHAASFDVIIISAGPTATILAARLSDGPTRVLDLGHFDLEYEWMKFAIQENEKIVGGRANNELEMHNKYLGNSGSNVTAEVDDIWEYVASGEATVIESVERNND